MDGYATRLEQAVSMIDHEDNSPVRQSKVKNYIVSLRISAFLAKGLDDITALSEVYRIID